MFCFAAFLVFAVLAVFSARYRPLAAGAWRCVLRRVTFRPCDVSWGAELKARLVGRLVFTHPRLARFVHRWIEALSFAFVALSVWSLLAVGTAALNLWVYDTCDPWSGESCSLSGDACGVEQDRPRLAEALRDGRAGEWLVGPLLRFGETLSRVPDRVRGWDAAAYLAPTATFARPFDARRPVALEVIDPGCRSCRTLTANLRRAGALESLNVSYLLYPIPRSSSGATRFPHSGRVAAYVEAAKRVPLPGAAVPPGDWRLLEQLLAEPDAGGWDLQYAINSLLSAAEVERTLHRLLRESGYDDAAVARIADLAGSADVLESLRAQRRLVEQSIRTVRIPTLLIGGRRFDRVIGEARLRELVKQARRR